MAIEVRLCRSHFRRLSECGEAEARALVFMREILSEDDIEQLMCSGYVAVRSPSLTNRVYRIPAQTGPVAVYESGKLVMWLCVQPLERLPAADVVVMHKLMIEGCEEEYLRRANVDHAANRILYL